MSEMNFEKKFGQSAIFVTSTLMVDGGVPPSSSPAALLKEAIHVISCGYEDKTEWGTEVRKRKSISLYMCMLVIIRFSNVLVPMAITTTVRLDLRLNHRGYLNGFQDALSWLEVSLLHA